MPDNQAVALRDKTKNFFISSKAFHAEHGFCPVRHFMAAVTDKWSLLVIYNLSYHGTLRFSELRRYVPDVSARMLSVTLKKLEENRLLVRTAYAEVPPRVEYRLTDLGKGLAERLMDVTSWMVEHY